MGQASIVRAFGLMLIIIGVAMVGPFLLALALGEPSAERYLFGAFVALLTGAGGLAASTDRRVVTDFRGALVITLLWWIAAPAFASIPLALSDLSIFDAYFETVSAMTTTGAWLSNEAAIADRPEMLWRAQLQWLGGLSSLAIAAAIFIRPAFVGIDTLLPPFSRGDRASYLRAIRNAVISFSSVYLLVTLVCFILQMLAGTPVLDAGVISMSMVASGGFIPHADGLSAYPFAATGFLLPFIIIGGANFILVTRITRGAAQKSRDVETGVYLLAIVVIGFVFWLSAGAGDLDLIPAQMFNAASLFSTNGVILGEGPTLPLALVTVIIGGSAVSTAGGFKILRWMVIFRRAREEIRLLITPRGVFGKSTVANELGVWIHFLVFTMTLGAFILVITLGGHSFELAATTATAILANAGPAISMAEGAESGFAVFDAPLRAVLCAGMILGRLEAVVALAIFNRAFWRS
ncbi:MAG: potassium transporter TrkG [Pseudomonadota bacterium]